MENLRLKYLLYLYVGQEHRAIFFTFTEYAKIYEISALTSFASQFVCEVETLLKTLNK